MNRTFWLLVGVLVGNAVAQGQTGRAAEQSARDLVRVSALPNAVIELAQGRVKTFLNLQNQIVGCATGDYDGADSNSVPTANPPSTRVVDLTRKAGSWYLVLQTSLPSACNVQGECGAGSAVSLVWFKLNLTLQVLSQKVYTLEECQSNTFLNRWSGRARTDAPDADDPKLELQRGVLEVFVGVLDDKANVASFTGLRYQKAFPEQGVVVTPFFSLF